MFLHGDVTLSSRRLDLQTYHDIGITISVSRYHTIQRHMGKFEAIGNVHKHLDSGNKALHEDKKSLIIWIIWKLLFPSFILLTKEVRLQLQPRAGWGRGSAF